MSAYDPKNHIIGKVYALTQENMCALLSHIDQLKEEREGLIADLIGQEHELGSKIERLEKEMEDTAVLYEELDTNMAELTNDFDELKKENESLLDELQEANDYIDSHYGERD